MAKMQALNQLFPTYLHAEMIDESIIEVQEPVIPRHIGTVIAGTKVHAVNIDFTDVDEIKMHIYPTFEDYRSGNSIVEKVYFNYGREESKIGDRASSTTEGST